MPFFSYKAVDPAGRKVQGRIDALNLVDLEMRLRRMELDLIDGSPVSQRSLFGGKSVSRAELIHFCFHMEMLARSGVPILEGLADLRDTLENPRFREVVASLIEAIEGGQRLSQAMAGQPKVFDHVFVSLIHAGETSGQLPEILRNLSDALKWEDELAAQTKRVVMYPAFVGIVVLSAIVFLMIYMVPQLKTFVRNMEQSLPLHAQALFFVSDLLLAYWYLFLFVPVLMFLLGKAALSSSPLARERFDAFKLKLPFIGGILRKIILSRFASTFALLYSARVSIIDAVHISQGIVGNQAIRHSLEIIEQAIGEGASITLAFQKAGFFPPLIIRMLRIGENTGALDEALRNVSYFYNRDVRESVEKTQQLIEPALTLVLGCLLGWIMLSVLGPVYDVITKIGI